MKILLISLFPLFLAASPAFSAIVATPVPYSHGGVALEGYLAYDDALPGKRPGVLVVHEWWGLNDYVKMRARQLAELGYVAFAADMYGKGVVTRDPKEAGSLSGRIRGTPLLRERAAAGLDLLRRQDRVDPARIAAMGYCFGGTTVLELAWSGADLLGVVSFHGGLTRPKASDLGKIRAKILVLHGADDTFVPASDIADFQEAVRREGLDWQMISYGGAVHAFTNPEADRAGLKGVAYQAAADRRSWIHMKAFFSEIFGGR